MANSPAGRSTAWQREIPPGRRDLRGRKSNRRATTDHADGHGVQKGEPEKGADDGPIVQAQRLSLSVQSETSVFAFSFGTDHQVPAHTAIAKTPGRPIDQLTLPNGSPARQAGPTRPQIEEASHRSRGWARIKKGNQKKVLTTGPIVARRDACLYQCNPRHPCLPSALAPTIKCRPIRLSPKRPVGQSTN